MIDHGGTSRSPKSPVNVLWRLPRERLINIPGQYAQQFLATDSLNARGVKSDGMAARIHQGGVLNQLPPPPPLATMAPLVESNANSVSVPVLQFAVGP